AAAYLNAGDQVLRSCPIVICCDHTEPGRELPYDLVQYSDSGRLAFHPKLLVLDYGEVVRVVVSSANLTRSGWTSALELFFFEDLIPGKRHAWAAPLLAFVDGVQAGLPEAAATRLEQFQSLLKRVKPMRRTKGTAQLISSFAAPLIDALTAVAPTADRL